MQMYFGVSLILLAIASVQAGNVAASDPLPEGERNATKSLDAESLYNRFPGGKTPGWPQSEVPALRGGLFMVTALLSAALLAPPPMTILLGTIATVKYLMSVYHRHMFRKDYDEADQDFRELIARFVTLETEEWRRMKKMLRTKKSGSP